MESAVPPGATICVTGATGFVASHIIHALQVRGYRVRGTVRDLEKAAKLPDEYAALLKPDFQASPLALFEADLSTPGSFDEAFRGCACVVHTAASVAVSSLNPERDIVEP